MISEGLFIFNMIDKKITITKTARYFVNGDLSANTKEIWFVCHGYAQLASYFLKNFDGLRNEQTVIVAPEGLHRFYWSGFSGRVVASWMTKEERQDDINDYVAFLSAVYEEVTKDLDLNKVTVNVLGFSQGAATVCRWLVSGGVRADNLILWAGAIPDDIDLKNFGKVFSKLNVTLVLGDQDEFITNEQSRAYEQHLKDNDVIYEMFRFKGKHVIDETCLKEIVEKLRSKERH